MNPQKTIGWATVLIVCVEEGSVKILFEEVEQADGFQDFVGKTFTYKSHVVAHSHLVKSKRRQFDFERQAGVIDLVEGERYVLLVNFYNNPPQIKCGCTKFWLNQIRDARPQPIGKVIYRVRCPAQGAEEEGLQVTDTLDSIMVRMTLRLGTNPTERLLSPEAEWYQKLGEDDFRLLPQRPLLPFWDDSMTHAVLKPPSGKSKRNRIV